MSEGPRTRLAAYALCVEDGALLLVRVAPGYPDSGVWTLPGGGVGFGENPRDAALRELEEESGLTGELDRLAFVDSVAGENEMETGPDRYHGVRIVYTARITGGELRDEVEESTDKAEWATLPHLDGRRVVDLVETALEWLAAERASAEK